MKAFKRVWAAIVAFLGTVAGSIRGVVNGEELGRSIATALGAGISTDGLLQALIHDAPRFIGDPTWAGLTVSLLTLIADLHRRKGHGADVPLPNLNRP